MAMVKITCVKCNTDGWMSLIDTSFKGPYSCWKCRAKMLIHMEGNQLVSCEPMSQEDFDRFAEERERKKRMGGMGGSDYNYR
jgi:hypothetical protein